MATVPHELKTPISAIKMSLQLLENKQVGILNDEQNKLVESIKDDAVRLLKIAGELLNMTQVETGTMQMSVSPARPVEIVGYAVNANNTAALQKISGSGLRYLKISPMYWRTKKNSLGAYKPGFKCHPVFL